MKRMASLFLVFCLVLSLLPAVVSAGSEDKPTLRIVLTKNRLTKEPEDLPYLQAIAEEAGVNIEWEVNTGWSDEYRELKSVMMASGDLPDVLLGDGSVELSDIAQFPELFQDLTELLEYAPNLSAILESDQTLKTMATDDEGKIYGFPQYMGRQPALSTRQFINATWLDRLGLEVPTTWDELYDVLIAFRDNDANGNGDPNDEVPMDWNATLGYFNMHVKVAELGIPVSLNMNLGYYVQDGVVNNLFATEEFKELVTFLHKCYAEGLVNENVFTQDYTTFQSIARDGRVGFTVGWDILDRMGSENTDVYVAVAPMKPTPDYAGESLWDYCFYAMNYKGVEGAISADSQNKEAAMRFVDLFYAPRNSVQSYWGTIGECVQENDDGSYTVLPPADPTIDPGSWKWTNALADWGPMYIPDDLKIDLPVDLATIHELDVVYQDAVALLEPGDIWPGPFMNYTAEETTDLAHYNVDLENIFRNNYANFVTAGGIEEGWDAYVETLNSAGLQEANALYQAAFDRFYASMYGAE